MNGQIFIQGTMSKIIAKYLESQKNAQSNKEVDEEKSRSHAMPLIKKDSPSLSNCVANADRT